MEYYELLCYYNDLQEERLRIYDRYISSGSFATTINGGSWKKLAFTSDIKTTFTGTESEHNHTFSGTAAKHSHTVSTTGTAASNGLTISYSNGELTITTSHTHSVSATGTAAEANALTVSGTVGNKKLTPAGTLS